MYIIKTLRHQVLMRHVIKLDLLDVIPGLKTTMQRRAKINLHICKDSLTTAHS